MREKISRLKKKEEENDNEDLRKRISGTKIKSSTTTVVDSDSNDKCKIDDKSVSVESDQ